VEGLTEKYGMEYRRAYCDEHADLDLVHRHEREIFPLLHRRRLFAEVEHFLLYDVFTAEGFVNEDVFAYSNRAGDERTLVIYHNKYATARGWIRTSVGYSEKTGQGDDRTLVRKDLGTGLSLHRDSNYFCIYRDHVTGLEFIRGSQELCDRGMFIELNAFQYRVFLNIREVRDNGERQYARLTAFLDGQGVPSIDEALKELFLQPIHQPFKELVNAGLFRQLLDARVTRPRGQPDNNLLEGVEQKMLHLLQAIKQLQGTGGDEAAVAGDVRKQLDTVLRLPTLVNWFPQPISSEVVAALEYLEISLTDQPQQWGPLFGWVFVASLGRIAGNGGFAHLSRTWIDELLLGRILLDALRRLGLEDHSARQAVCLVKLLTTHQRWFETQAPEKKRARQVLESLLRDGDVREFLQVNRYQDILWFNKEAFDALVWWLLLLAAIEDRGKEPAQLLAHYHVIQDLRRAEQQSEYQVEKLLAALNQDLPEKSEEPVLTPSERLLPK
jgi:hypothetical protein